MSVGNKKNLTRRDFVKKLGVTAGAIGAVSTMPGLAKSLYAGGRDHILIGRPLPLTGIMASFGESTPWLDNRILEMVNKDGGIYIEEYGKKVPIKLKIVDTESNPTKAAEVAATLIVKDKVDLIHVSHGPMNINPVAGVCERYKMPCVASFLPAEMFASGGPWRWSFCVGVAIKDFMPACTQMWGEVATNKVVGVLAGNETDGVAFAEGAAGYLPDNGYKVFDFGRFPLGNKDFSSLINRWKAEDVEIVFGNLSPPDFATVWRQCLRQSFVPKVCTIGRAIMFPTAVEALGEGLGAGLSSEAPWHKSFPFKSATFNETPETLCDAYEQAMGKQWTSALGHPYAGYEVIVDSLRRAKTLDKTKLRNAIAATELETLAGSTKFGEKDHFAVAPAGAQQWIKGGKYTYESVLVANKPYDNFPLDGKLKSISEFR